MGLMAWLRERIRMWLGIAPVIDYDFPIGALETRIALLEKQVDDFKKALKARAQVRALPRFSDYETAQVAALEDFREKN